MITEIELKYHLQEDVARRLLKQRRLNGFPLGAFSIKDVKDIYFDTPDRRIARAGYAMRFRRKGLRAEVQLKSLQAAQGPRHTRQELHIPTQFPTQPDRWPQTPEASFLRDIIGNQSLQPLFTIHQTRHEAPVFDEDGNPLALLSLDDVRWMAEGKEARAWELEIELLPGGKDSALQRLQAALAAMPGLFPQKTSKYERGLALLKRSLQDDLGM